MDRKKLNAYIKEAYNCVPETPWAKYPEYSGMNYLDMTVGFFFPEE